MTAPLKNKENIVFGVILMGGTGLLIGYFLYSPLLMVIAGSIGTAIGALVGWVGGRRFMTIIAIGTIAGAALGYQYDDRDILIMATGSGAAIAGFLASQIELFLRRP